MTDEKREYLTKQKYDELVAELKDLKNVKRKEVAEALDYARDLGDLSENAEYHEARAQQANIEDRISKLEGILKNTIVVEDRHGDHVVIGSTVVVEKIDGTKKDDSYDCRLGRVGYFVRKNIQQISDRLRGFGKKERRPLFF